MFFMFLGVGSLKLQLCLSLIRGSVVEVLGKCFYYKSLRRLFGVSNSRLASHRICAAFEEFYGVPDSVFKVHFGFPI